MHCTILSDCKRLTGADHCESDQNVFGVPELVEMPERCRENAVEQSEGQTGVREQSHKQLHLASSQQAHCALCTRERTQWEREQNTLRKQNRFCRSVCSVLYSTVDFEAY